MSLQTKKERHDSSISLGCFVQALVGKCITIDLRNESSVTGDIKEVDGYMNILIENAHFEDPDGNRQMYNTLFVKGRNIRFIHIPKQVSVREAILQFLKTYSGHSKEPKTSLQRFRMQKLRKKQEETRDIVAKINKNKEQTNT